MSVPNGFADGDLGLSGPTAEERRRAVCAAMTKAPGLVRFATRYTRSLPDAEDAYQRAMEIALTRAPVTEPRPFMAWLHTVLKNEALAVARAQRREGPTPDDDLATAFAESVEDGLAPEIVVEWRDRYRAIQDALAGLSEAQRVCLMLQSAGASYARIGELTGYSPRKIERSVLEGRKSLHAWEVGLASGDVCGDLLPAIDRVAAGEASGAESRAVRRHLRHCHPCRALLRTRRESREWLAALVPVALVGAEALRAAPPDPSPYLAYWERVTTGMTVRMGQVVQVAMDLQGTALAKVGAGTAAVAIAGAAGGPLVVDAMRPAEGPSRPGLEVVQAAERPSAAASAGIVSSSATPTAAAARGARARVGSYRPPARRAGGPAAVAGRADLSAPASPATSSATTSRASAVALEFGP